MTGKRLKGNTLYKDMKPTFAEALRMCKAGNPYLALNISVKALTYLRSWAAYHGLSVKRDDRDAWVLPYKPPSKVEALKTFLSGGVGVKQFDNVSINTVRNYVFRWNRVNETNWKTRQDGDRIITIYMGPPAAPVPAGQLIDNATLV